MTETQETRIVALEGRDVQVQRPSDAQVALLMRETKILQRLLNESERVGPDAPLTVEQRDRMMTATSRCFDIFEAVVVTEEDREFVVDLIIGNKLGLAGLINLVRAFAPGAGEASAKPTVRRGPGRPRKNAAK